MSSHLEFTQWVPFPLERVFDFFSNPENLPRIMPAASGTRLIALHRQPPPVALSGTLNDKAAGIGSTIITSFRVFPPLPIRARWIARITEFEWNHQRPFTPLAASPPVCRRDPQRRDRHAGPRWN
jgi:ligand-binding SRPBCC domain-containing protein